MPDYSDVTVCGFRYEIPPAKATALRRPADEPGVLLIQPGDVDGQLQRDLAEHGCCVHVPAEWDDAAGSRGRLHGLPDSRKTPGAPPAREAAATP